MSKISVIGLDLAKNVFQLHGVDEAGLPVIRKKLRRCLVGMEACGGTHYWARKIGKFGHDVKIIAREEMYRTA